MKKHYYKEDILDICNYNHLTVDEIFEKISERYENPGKSSIYRNVEELVASGDLKKIDGIGNKAYFEKNIGDHMHLIDINTGVIVDIDEPKINTSNLPDNFKKYSMDIKVFGEFE